VFRFERWHLKIKIMDTEKQIIKRMEDYGYTRLDAIASMNLGERSKAAARASASRKRRKELMDYYDMDFETACLVVNKENERALANAP
jgi:DNA-binding protein H-NS